MSYRYGENPFAQLRRRSFEDMLARHTEAEHSFDGKLVDLDRAVSKKDRRALKEQGLEGIECHRCGLRVSRDDEDHVMVKYVGSPAQKVKREDFVYTKFPCVRP